MPHLHLILRALAARHTDDRAQAQDPRTRPWHSTQPQFSSISPTPRRAAVARSAYARLRDRARGSPRVWEGCRSGVDKAWTDDFFITPEPGLRH